MKWRSPPRAIKALLVALLFGVTLIAARLVLMPRSATYFSSGGPRPLQSDEIGQWQAVRHLYSEMEATGDVFRTWSQSSQDMWKYAIAFTAYGMPSLAMRQPDQAEVAGYFLAVMIHKMESKKVWDDWQRYGFGSDPVCKDNIMYKGHLNLMYGLHVMLTGSERYARQFAWLSHKMAEEMRVQPGRQYAGLVCEPDRYFAQCNAIGLLGLSLHDRLYGTRYMVETGEEVLRFIKTKMTDETTGLYRESYHPSHNTALPYLSGYANAWTLAILRHLDPKAQDQLYPRWKQTFVHQLGPFAYVSETPKGGISRVASLFGLLAAKEFGDEALFGKLRNTIDLLGGLVPGLENGDLHYALADDTLLNGMSLSFKLHVGWDQILAHPWQGFGHRRTPPQISRLGEPTIEGLRAL
jgi:hypothetical protein